MKKRREYDDDDGRQIADMNVDGMPWYTPNASSTPDPKQSEPLELTREEKVSLYAGALKAGLLVAAAFIGVYFLVILLMTIIW